MKSTKNQSLNASEKIVERALCVGIKAEIIDKSKPRSRRYSANGSTSAPQKVVMLNNIRMSLAQARQYVSAREA